MSFRALALLITAQAFSFSALASNDTPTFSAFSAGDRLFVTILADTCNAVGASLEVSGLCRSDRMTKNFATVCDASLLVMSTERACPDQNLEAKVVTLNLKNSKVAREARVLNLTYLGQEIEVKLNQ
jgi:hypothetical protein